MRNLTFNGVSSLDLGVAISGEGSYNAPSRDQSVITIPGKNGSLIIDNGRFNNITVRYPAFVVGNLPVNAADIRAWLLSPRGYARLEDDYHPDEYRLAVYSGSVDFSTTAWNQHGEMKLAFNCKPQRFLTSGEASVSINSGDSITNPTPYDALPIITVTGTGSGTLSVAGTTVSFDGLTGGIVLDCEAQDASYGGLNANALMTGAFPVLPSGTSTILFTGGITAVSITPRWWRL